MGDEAESNISADVHHAYMLAEAHASAGEIKLYQLQHDDFDAEGDRRPVLSW